MFVVIPPPRPADGSLGILETNNILSKPTGCDLVVGEGTYVLQDDLLLATPPPHPTDAPGANNNPLAPITRPPTVGTKISALAISTVEPAPGLRLGKDGKSSSNKGEEENGFGSSANYNTMPVFGADNPSLAAPAPAKGKKKEDKVKPKTGMVKSNSSFVSRVLLSDSITKRMADRSASGILAITNVNRALFFLDLSSSNKTDHLCKVLFTKAHALCHHINPATKSAGHLDVILGFNSGDIIWYEPMSQKYARINKNGAINASPVIDIQWLPNRDNLFLAAHADGTLVVYDKEKDDAEFIAEEAAAAAPSRYTLRILKSVKSQNQKSNPLAAWRVSNSRPNKVAFSPDSTHLAVASEDGTLCIVDFIAERLLDVHRSFYGAMLTVTWSPDARYILSAGQDDLISIWSMAEHRLIARCAGHESWVSDVKFDPWRCDGERNYRFGSVGEDRRLCLWDFGVGMLGRPKRERMASLSPSTSVISGGGQKGMSNEDLTKQDGANVVHGQHDVVHDVDGKGAVPMLPPVVNKIVGEWPLCSISFQEGSVLTSDEHAHVKEWIRPT